MNDEIFEPSAIDFYDYDAIEKLHKNRSKKYIDFVRKWHEAKGKNDERAKQKAFKAMQKHKKQDEVIKEKCNETGYYWY